MSKCRQFFIILFSFLCLDIGALASTQGQALDKIVAIVNESVITQTELDVALNQIKKQLVSSGTAIPNQEQLKNQVLDQLINKKLQLDLAEQAHIKVDDGELNKVVARIAAQNKIPVSVLYEKIKAEGLSKQAYLKELREEVTIQHVQEQNLSGKIRISSQDVDDFMRSVAWQALSGKEYHLEDILIALPDNPSTQTIANAKNRAEELIAKIRGGLNFHEATKGDNKAMEGGDLGWRKLPEVPSAFANEITHAKEKDILGPIQTPNGFHILQVAGIRDANKSDHSVANRKQIEQLLYQRKFEEALQGWVTKLRGQAFINTHPDV